MKNIFSDFQDYLDADPAGVKLPKIEIDQNLLSQLKLPPESSSYDILKALSREGIKKRGIDKYPNKKEYYDRAKYELETFDELGFSDYILLNWEIIGFAKKSGITTGNGRGSAPGSLVLYLLEVTEEDPIKYGLIFERFVSKSRAKKIFDKRGEVFLDGSLVPDVDSDFCYERRAEVIKFVEERYKERTAKILTFNTFSSKLCIREAVKYFDKADEEFANAISDSIPKKHGIVSSLENASESSEKFKEWKERNQFTFSQAIKVEDLIKNEGNHPSGVAIASQRIEDIMPLQLNKDGELISGYDMDDVAALCVKFDILGLRTLTIADLTCKKLGISLKDIDPEDPFIYEKLQDFKHNSGLFQISASTNSLVCQQVKPLNLDELSDVIALARPSSLAYVGEYIKQKNFPTDLGVCPTLDELLKPTKNIFLFQETFMQACHKVFGFSLEEAETFRRVISKKKIEEMPAWESKIFEAADKEGLPKRAAEYFWGASEAAANYGFNKCADGSQIVITNTGSKALMDVSVGEDVLTLNEDTMKNEFKKVTDKIISEEVEMYLFELACGRSVICSMDHKFLTKEGMIAIGEIVQKDLSIIFDNYLEYFKEFPLNDNYIVSNLGRIYSKKRMGRNNTRTYGGSFCERLLDKDGYPKVYFYKKNQGKKYFVHRVVALTFLDNADGSLVVNHKNGIKTDNRVENLEWITVAENNRHAYKTGLNSIEASTNRLPRLCGEDHGCAKLTWEKVNEIRRLFEEEGISKSALAKMFNISKTTSGRIINKKLWK